MTRKNRIVFIVEGGKTEQLILKNLNKVFFETMDLEVIALSSACNIYDLWNTLKKDDFETDIIEVIKEKHANDKKFMNRFGEIIGDDFSEVYLFFDFDGHQNNLPKDVDGNEVVKQMLETFDNETELGKMLISYPMVEAIRDYREEYGICYRCTTEAYVNVHYKRQLNGIYTYQNLTTLTKDDWKKLIMIFIKRCQCLFRFKKEEMYYQSNIQAIDIFKKQCQNFIVPYHKVLVISAFPEFLVEYFGKSFFGS